MTTFEIDTHSRCALINITRQVREAVKQSSVVEGQAVVYCPHTTAGITINENADPDVCADILAGLDALIPKLAYRHGEGNSDAHIKASLVGSSAAVPIHGGEPVLGVWQAVFFCEFDGPRSRRFYVTATGSVCR